MKGCFLPASSTLLVVLCLQGTPVPETPWPKRVAEPAFVSTGTSSLPAALRDELLRWDEFTQGKNALPESLTIARADLNGDGLDEFVVQSAQTYSGGPMMQVFELRIGKFVAIAAGQGTLYFGPKVNGYLEIVSQSSAGGGGYTRILDRFEGDRYQPVRLTDYEATEDGGPLRFVRERDPRPFRRQDPRAKTIDDELFFRVIDFRKK